MAEKDGGKVAGVRADGAVTLQIGEEKYCESGELQFTSYGLSGIPVFQIRPDIKSFKQIPSVFILPGKKAVQHTHI